MDGLEYRAAFQDDAAGRAAANANIIAVHGLDLTLWDERVGWDPDYVPFAFLDGETVVALTCVYVMEMIVRGEWRRVAQFSSVGTLPDYRMRGLNAELTRRAMEWVRNEELRGTFLFSDDDATGFYAKQGFVERPEWKHRGAMQASSRPAYRLLQYDADEDLILRLAHERAPVSHQLAARAPKHLLFHLLYGNAGELRYVEELDLLVCCDEKDGVLTVYDIIGPEMSNWADIGPRVAGATVSKVEFELTPDLLGLERTEACEHQDNRLHVLPDEDLVQGQVMFPFTAHA